VTPAVLRDRLEIPILTKHVTAAYQYSSTSRHDISPTNH